MNPYVQKQLVAIIDKTQRMEMYMETNYEKAVEILKSFTVEEAEVLESVGQVYMNTAQVIRTAIEDFQEEGAFDENIF